MHAKKVLSDSKEKNKLEIIDNWSILKEKNVLRPQEDFLFIKLITSLE
jgi:hypothetical protein